MKKTPTTMNIKPAQKSFGFLICIRSSDFVPALHRRRPGLDPKKV
jgi:hypothetical protein